MTKPLLFTGLLMLMACPTPPTPNNSPNSTPGSNAAPTPGGTNGPGPNNQGQNNVQDQGQNNNGPGNAGQNNAGPGNGTPDNGNGTNNQGGNPDGPPPGTVAQGPGEGDGQPGENQELTVPSDEDIEKDGSIMGVFNDLGGQELPPQYTQKSVEAMDHVTISGNITCKGDECDVPFVLRITPSFQPSEEDGPLSENLKMEEGGTITSASISRGGGDYEIKVPKSNGRVVLELLLDQDDDGKASMGEKFVIYEGGGGIPVNEDRADIDFQFSPANLKAPLGGAKPPGDNGPQ